MRFGYAPPLGTVQPLAGRIVSPWSEESIGHFLRAAAIGIGTTDRAWTANLALFVPFHVAVPGHTVYEGWAACGSGAGGNFDIGLYDLAGNRLTSSGATARTAATQVSTAAMANYALPVGDYYMAFACDGTTAFQGQTLTTPGVIEASGCCEMAAAYPLPLSATLVKATTQAIMPLFGLNLRTVAP